MRNGTHANDKGNPYGPHFSLREPYGGFSMGPTRKHNPKQNFLKIKIFFKCRYRE